MNTLAWKNRFNPFIVQDLVRIGEQACFEISLSPQELLIIRSCVAAGANIYYPDKQISIEHWLDGIEACMTCDDVADCIEASDAVHNALNLFLQDAFNPNAGSTTPPPDSVLNGNAYGSNPSCNLNRAWGNIRDGLIERSFQRTIDVLDMIELTTDNQELLSETLAGIPVLGEVFETIGTDSWLNWFDEVREFAADAFAAGDTVDFRDAAACDLFCLYRQTCTLSPLQIYEYWRDRAISLDSSFADAWASIQTIIAALASPQEQTGEFFVCFLMAAQYGFQNFINDWFGVRIGASKTDLLLGEQSDDWMILCPDCPGTTYEVWNFEGGTLMTTGSLVFGVPFDITPYETVAGVFTLALVLTAGDYSIQTAFNPSPVAGANGNDWAYTDTSNNLQLGVFPPLTADTLPSPINARFSGLPDLTAMAIGAGETFTMSVTAQPL